MRKASKIEMSVIQDLSLAIGDLTDDDPEVAMLREENGTPIGESYSDFVNGEQPNQFVIYLVSGKRVRVTVEEI